MDSIQTSQVLKSPQSMQSKSQPTVSLIAVGYCPRCATLSTNSRTFSSRIVPIKRGLPLMISWKGDRVFDGDGTSRHRTCFDDMKGDSSFAATLEMAPEQIASWHAVKCFFNKMVNVNDRPLRAVLREMGVQQICHEKPEVIELFLDTMVLDNDDEDQRQGVSATYKNVKGFQPLHLICAPFRGGKKHGNSGNVTFNMIKAAAKRLREQYDPHIPIVVRMDAGFFDGDLFWQLDISNIGLVCSGRM